MSRRKSAIVIALVALGSAASTIPAHAGCGGGRCGIGGLGGYSSVRNIVRSYTQPSQNYAQPRYSQPPQQAYSQPAYNQPSYSQPQPTYGQPSAPIQSRIVHTSPARTVTSVPGGTSQIATSSVTSAPQGGFSQPAQRSSVSPGQQQFQQQQSQSTQPQQTQQAQNNSASPEQSALQLLAGGASQSSTGAAPATASIPQFQTQTNPNVGSWVATLPGNASVTLDLNNDGSFKWTANSKGQNSSFDGNYTIQNGSLSLIRSGDNGKLSGTMTASGSGAFQFKVAGASNGLDFKRR